MVGLALSWSHHRGFGALSGGYRENEKEQAISVARMVVQLPGRMMHRHHVDTTMLLSRKENAGEARRCPR